MTQPPASRLYRTIVHILEQGIGSGRYPVGSKLPPERELAERYGVSRPTVREAIIAMEVRGVVEVRVGSGAFVRQQPEKRNADGFETSAIELTEARLLIEGEVAALAATVISPDEVDELAQIAREIEADDADPASNDDADGRFHRAIAAATRNGALVEAVDRLWTLRRTSKEAALLHEKARKHDNGPVIREHRRIIDALRSGDPDRARSAMRDHLGQVLETLLFATEEKAIATARQTARLRRDRVARITARAGEAA